MTDKQLAYCFSGLKKNELWEIANFFEFKVNPKCKKDELLHEIAHCLCEDPESWLNKLPERDTEMLMNLVEAGVDHRIETDICDCPSVIELLKMVDSVYLEDFYSVITLCKPLADAIAPYVRKVFEANQNNGRYMMEKVIIGYLSIYGVISGQDLVDILFRDLEIDEDIERISNMITECPIIKIYREFIEGENYFVAPNMFSIEYVLERRKELKQDGEYRYYPWPDAIEAGENFPYNCFGMDTKEGQDLIDMLAELGYDQLDQEDIIHEIWYRAQFAGDQLAGESLFDCLSDKQDEFESFDEYKKCVDVLTAYANSLPKWVLKGKSANEAELMKISIKVDDGGGDDIELSKPRYECTALCNTSDNVGWAWMILSKSDKEASKFKRTVAS